METKTVQKLGLLCVSIALCSAASWWSGGREAEQQTRRIAELPPAVSEKPLLVTVYVSGAVLKPGMYQVPKGSRAGQVIQLAGGLTEEADTDRVNLAQLCKDGGHIKVPRLLQARMKRRAAGSGGERAAEAKEGAGEKDTGNRKARNRTGNGTGRRNLKMSEEVSGTQPGKDPGVVHLNSAGEAELEQLPGVGKSTARQILAYRRRHRFLRIEDVMRVPGIGPAKFKKMRGRLAL